MNHKKRQVIAQSPKATGKVGFVIGSLMRGGAEMHLAQLLPVLKQRGWEVSVFLIGPTGPVANDLQKAGIKIAPKQSVRVPPWLPVWLRRVTRFTLLSPKFLFFAWHQRRGIIHFFLPEAFIIGGMLTFSWHRRLIMSRRGMTTYRSKYPSPVIAIERFLQHRMKLLLGNSARVVDELLSDGVPKERVRLIYNGLALDRLDPPGAIREKLRDELGISQTELVLVTLANLHPYKGHADLIKALGKLKSAGRLPADWTLLLIGRNISLLGTELLTTSSNNYQSRLESMCEKLDLQSHVKFLGERADAPTLLRCADIGVFPSHEEGFSNALIEQMAAGLAIVASDVGGNAEALDEGRAGIIVPPKEPTALAKAIGRLIEEPDTRKSFGETARARAFENYTIARCADDYENVYRELLGHQ
ncbi:MAG: glycosyltransferase [Rhizobiales bacterium]|nr:glycosyltransferase [Hyphomicrobiales bacterium]